MADQRHTTKNVTGSGKAATTQMLDFLRNHVLSVTDLTRKNKLTEILDKFAGEKSTEIFVVQNSKKPEGKAVIADLEYFQELLAYKEALDWATDKVMLDVVRDRAKNDGGQRVSLGELVAEEGFDAKEIMKLADDREEEY